MAAESMDGLNLTPIEDTVQGLSDTETCYEVEGLGERAAVCITREEPSDVQVNLWAIARLIDEDGETIHEHGRACKCPAVQVGISIDLLRSGKMTISEFVERVPTTR